MSTLGRGAGDVGRGFRFLNAHPRLWGWVIAPGVLTLAILIGLIVGVAHLVDPLVGWATGWLPGFLQGIVGALLSIVVVVAVGFGALLVFVTVVGIVAGPFNEMLSEAIEARVTRRPAPKFSLRALLRSAAIGLVHGLRRLGVALLGFLLLFVLGFVPVIGTLAALAIGFWLAARAAAYDCYDAVLARRELSYREKHAYLARHRRRSMGLGAMVAAMLFVPGLNLVALGLGAAGATLADLDPNSASLRDAARSG
jgi:CysZ protein